MVNGVLYVTSPDNGWALDARDGREMWHYFWRTRGGTPIGNRGFGLWNNALFMVTPDDFIVSLDAKTGKERWNKEFAPFTQQYFSTIAPMVIGNTVIVGTGNDLDSPGYLQAYDADTGKELWRFYTVPQNAGDPGVDTWPSLQAARYGGGHPWLPGVYDPETNLYIFGTGNPIPAYTLGRGEGDNLFTCALIAVDVATGKMKWYFQTSPHDMHDWDSAQTPVLFEGTVGGKKRKLVATAARNGYFFTLDRDDRREGRGHEVRQRHQLGQVHRPEGIGPARADQGSDRRRRARPRRPRAARSTGSRRPTRRSPGLFYVSERNGHSIYYLTDPDPRGSMGLAGKEEVFVGNTGNFLTAIDPLTGKVAWRRPYPSAGGTRHVRRRRLRPADHRRQAGVRRRQRRQLRRLGRGHRHADLAHAHRRRHQPADDLHARRAPVHPRRDHRHALRVRAVSVAMVSRASRSRVVVARPGGGAARRGGGRVPRGRRRRPAPPQRVYVSNETAGTVAVIDPATGNVLAAIPVGKRPRGLRVSRDGKQLYVALSGSPIAPPGVDESTLPPADRSADGIAVVDIATRKIVRTIPSGQDPEAFDLSPDGRWLYVSNEETAEMSVVDVAAARSPSAFRSATSPRA